jgi:hypothetical protein
MKPAYLRRHAETVLIILAAQFLVGMLLNLFVTLPRAHPGSTGDNYFARSWASLLWLLSGDGGWTLLVHVSLAIVLVVATLALFVRSLSPRGRGWRWGSGIALVFTLGAFFNGLSFANYNEDISSMIMASCWLLAVIPVVVVLIRNRKASAAAALPTAT